MHNFEQALRESRNYELVANFKSKFSELVLTTHIRLIESDAAKIYTMEIFKEVKDEIMKASAMIVKSRFSRGLSYSRGFPSSNMFYVMKEEYVDHIPTSLVLSRWAKDAKI
ncbi:hypothetical protein KIW84_011818 [Lathyrus oleraceus]|uniref:Protein FAR1-RELATED SEQUENCE n=1 Tax=Pisum sativum TaxID=3888 RepID=A0A9D5BG00_PEA|nr:hypothetical protein KIW84_011818 [Pisum sativum]